MSRHSKSSSVKKRSPSQASEKSAENDRSDDRSPETRRGDEIRTAAHRETVEAFVVAFILALLFRAFVAEAFVIPTGSMAPTLMGAHKDLTCQRCDYQFPTGASLERRGPTTENAVVGGICPNCRYANPLDLSDNVNHSTFSGDRILVSKFAYTLADPERWDVIVFKFPGNPKQNYIKRLVGLPNETLTLRHGDVYAHPTGTDQRKEILRKPPETLLAMRHPVYDSTFQAPELIAADYPSRWQPWTSGAEQPPDDSWQVKRDQDGLTATVDADDATGPQWLRYYHRWPDDDEWEQAAAGLSLASVDPYSSRLITDFHAYDAYLYVDADRVYDRKPSHGGGSLLKGLIGSSYSGGVLKSTYRSRDGLDQFQGRITYGSHDMARDGLHWVGDLILETDIETSPESEQLLLELVESGVKYQCRIDLNDGRAELSIRDSQQQRSFDGDAASGVTREASTSVTAGSRHRIRFSNCDDQMLMWIDDSVVQWNGPTTFDARRFRPDSQNHPQFSAGQHPLDAAPVGVAIEGGEATIRHLRIDRDKYYIATKSSSSGVFDYDMQKLREIAGNRVSLGDVQELMGLPELWSKFPAWNARRTVSFELHEDQFFPMGDNSPESLDARCWAGAKQGLGMPISVDRDAYRWSDASYVPRDLLVGKALMIFWPHPWNSPVPFTPNFQRMKLIR